MQAQRFYLDAPGVHIGVGDRFHHRPYYNYKADSAPGTVARRAERYRAAFVSRTATALGTITLGIGDKV